MTNWLTRRWVTAGELEAIFDEASAMGADVIMTKDDFLAAYSPREKIAKIILPKPALNH